MQRPPCDIEIDIGQDNGDYWNQYPEAELTPAFNRNSSENETHKNVQVSAFDAEPKEKNWLDEKKEMLMKPMKKTIGKKSKNPIIQKKK